MPRSTPTIEELNALAPSGAAAALTVLFEEAPTFVERLVAARPFADEADLFDRARAIALGLPDEEAIELVNAHPRLGAPKETVSALSAREQGYDRAGRQASETLTDRLERLNDDYERTFGFRYCVFVAGRSREALIPEWEARLATGTRDEELARARRDVVAIARDRYRRLLSEADGGGDRG